MAWQGSPTAVTGCPVPAAEQRGEQQALGDRGVLVLVEQHHAGTPRAGSGRPRGGCRPASPTARSGRRSRAGRGGSSRRAVAATSSARSVRPCRRTPRRAPWRSRAVPDPAGPAAPRAPRRTPHGSVLTRCSDSSPSRASRSPTSADTALGRAPDTGRGRRRARGRRAGSGWRRRAAGRWAPGRCAGRGRVSSRPANAWYVETRGSPGRVVRGPPASGSVTPGPRPAPCGPARPARRPPCW